MYVGLIQSIQVYLATNRRMTLEPYVSKNKIYQIVVDLASEIER